MTKTFRLMSKIILKKTECWRCLTIFTSENVLSGRLVWYVKQEPIKIDFFSDSNS